MLDGPEPRRASAVGPAGELHGNREADDIKLDHPQFTEKDLKPPSQWRLIGRDVQRLDVPLKVNGTAKYGIDVQMPGMLYASILRPPVATCPHPLYGDGSENGPVKVDGRRRR